MSVENKKQTVIAPDEDSRAEIDKNVDDSQLLYCRKNGINPNAETNDNGGNDK